MRTFWAGHRALYRGTGGRIGLRRPTADKWGMFRLRTVGRRSGEERVAILGYFEDGPDLVTLAMNGWGEAEPAWWLNLQARPDAVVDSRGRARSGPVPPTGRSGTACGLAGRRYDKVDAYAALRSRRRRSSFFEPRADVEATPPGP